MKRELFWFVGILTIYFLHLKLDFYYTVLLSLILLIEILREYGVFQEITFQNKKLEESTLYYYDFFGNYSNVNSLFQKVCDIFKEKNLDNNNYKIVGFYYDNPKTNKSNNRASIGILAYRQDLEEFFIKKGMKKNDIPKTDCVFSWLPFINILSIFVYVWRYYSKLREIQENMAVFKIKSEFPCVIEIYQNEKIELYIPLENDEILRIPITGKINKNS